MGAYHKKNIIIVDKQRKQLSVYEEAKDSFEYLLK